MKKLIIYFKNLLPKVEDRKEQYINDNVDIMLNCFTFEEQNEILKELTLRVYRRRIKEQEDTFQYLENLKEANQKLAH